MKIIKKSGKEEDYDITKIRKAIKKAFVDAGISIQENKDKIELILCDVTNNIKQKTEVTTGTIRLLVLEGMQGVKKTATDAWEKFDQKHKGNKHKSKKGVN